MNTEINIATAQFFGLSQNTVIVSLEKVCAKTGQSLLSAAKFLLLATPFLSLAIMLLALWGVAGKTTYADLGADRQVTSLEAETATNYPVSGTIAITPCGQDGKGSEIDSKNEPSIPANIDWEHTV